MPIDLAQLWSVSNWNLLIFEAINIILVQSSLCNPILLKSSQNRLNLFSIKVTLKPSKPSSLLCFALFAFF